MTLAAAALAVGPAGCEEETPQDVSMASCPNLLPTAGDTCTEPEMVCKYVVHQCYDLRHYICTGGVWEIQQECTPVGSGGAGGGGSGGSPGGGGSGGTATGGSGGAGGTAAGGSAGSGGTG